MEAAYRGVLDISDLPIGRTDHPDGNREKGIVINLKMNIAGNKDQEPMSRTAIKESYVGRQAKGAGTRTVQPYESYYQIRDILNELLENKRYRDYAIMLFGLSTGLRISDIVALKVSDVFDIQSGSFKKVLDIIEKKTKKSTVSAVDEVLITEAAIQGITKYFDSIGWKILPDEPLFKSEKVKDGYDGHLSECQGWRIVKAATSDAKVDIHVGSHTLRKTFLNIANAIGTASRLGNGSGMVLSDVMVLARHSKLSTTLRYTTLMKGRLASLRRGVSAFLLGKTRTVDLKMEYEWEDNDM
jgi:integrase